MKRIPHTYPNYISCSCSSKNLSLPVVIAQYFSEPGDCILPPPDHSLDYCYACRSEAELAWIQHASTSDLLLGVNYEWANNVNKTYYGRRLEGGSTHEDHHEDSNPLPSL